MLANDSAPEYGLFAGVARPYSSFVRRVDHASPIHRVAIHRVAIHRSGVTVDPKNDIYLALGLLPLAASNCLKVAIASPVLDYACC